MSRIDTVLVFAACVALTAFLYWYWVGASVLQDLGFIVMVMSLVAAVGAWLAITRANPRKTIVLLMLLLVLAPPIRLTESLPIRLPVISFYDVLIMAVGGVLLLRAWITSSRSGAGGLTPTSLLLLLFIPVTVLSMAYGSIGLGIPLSKRDWFEIAKIGLYFLAFYIGSQVVLRRGDLRFMFIVLVGAISASALFGLLQVYDVGNSRQLFLSFYAAPTFPAESIGVLQKHISVLGLRSSGTVGNPNEYALILSVGAVVAIALIIGRAFRGPGHIVLYAVVALIVTMIILSGSRIGIVAISVAATYLLGVMVWSKRANIVASGRRVAVHGNPLLLLAIVAITLAMVAFSAAHPVVGPQIESRLSRITGIIDWESDRSVQIRLSNLGLARTQLSRSPLLGDGPAEGEAAEEMRVLGSGVADNELLLVFLQLGLVGLTLYVVFWLSAFRLARSIRRSGSREAWLFGHAVVAILLVDVAGMLAAISFHDIRRMTLTCLLLGLCLAARRLTRTEEAEIPAVNQSDGAVTQS